MPTDLGGAEADLVSFVGDLEPLPLPEPVLLPPPEDFPPDLGLVLLPPALLDSFLTVGMERSENRRPLNVVTGVKRDTEGGGRVANC